MIEIPLLPPTDVKVCISGNCERNGSRKVIVRLKKGFRANPKIVIGVRFCLNMCIDGPNAQVIPEGLEEQRASRLGRDDSWNGFLRPPNPVTQVRQVIEYAMEDAA
jgi:hypothetical protein